VNLTPGSTTLDSSPAYDAAGNIYYQTQAGSTNNAKIARLQSDGSGGVLVYSSQHSKSPCPSPDGERLVFLNAATATGHYGLVTARADGTDVIRLPASSPYSATDVTWQRANQ
jgi:hypothetical protein